MTKNEKARMKAAEASPARMLEELHRIWPAAGKQWADENAMWKTRAENDARRIEAARLTGQKG